MVIKKYKLRTLYAGLALLASAPLLAQYTAPLPRVAREAQATSLGWVNIPDAPCHTCGGYYLQPNLSAFNEPVRPFKESDTSISADYVSFSRDNTSELRGDVMVVQSGRLIYADRAVVTRDPNTGKVAVIDLYGHIRAYEAGRLVSGNEAHLRVQTNSGVIQGVTYRVLLANENEILGYLMPVGEDKVSLTGLTAWGTASSVIQSAPGHSEFKDATYTTCSPTSNQWRVVARRINLNKDKGIGTARDARLELAGIPVFYTPYFEFPINNERKTGFLFPTMGSQTDGGYVMGWPFYWNIAPNYDMTITPRLYTKRGVWLGDMFRYLFPFSSGWMSLGVIPADQEFINFKREAKNQYKRKTPLVVALEKELADDSTTRNLVSFENITRYTPHLRSFVTYTRASDAYYFQDFTADASNLTINQLLQQGTLSYTTDHWNLVGMVQQYQTLHQINRANVGNLYKRMPEFDANGFYPKVLNYFDANFTGQSVYFTQERNPGQVIRNPSTGRYYAAPSISAPFQFPSGFFTPRVKFSATKYSVHDQFSDFNPVTKTYTKRPSNIDRTLPIVDMDSGLYFDRYFNLQHHDYMQTLEPRLYYLYIPFRNQNDIPVFDTAIIPFTYNALFLNNRFSGFDRIGDTNQVTLALTTRFIDQVNGSDILTASIGEIYYFDQRRVTLCHGIGCKDVARGFGEPPLDEDISPVAGWATYHFFPKWTLNGGFAWDPNVHRFMTAQSFFTYTPVPDGVINLGYNFLLHGDSITNLNGTRRQVNLHQIAVSFSMPVYDGLSALGVYNYNISHGTAQTYLFGAQYDTCCWAARVVGGRVFTYTGLAGQQQFTNSIYFQLVLKGLANYDPYSLGSLLATSIQGYHDPYATSRSIF